jgi:urease accessory protein
LNPRRVGRAVCVLAALSLAGPAFAHQGQSGGFLTGLAHPVSGLDHVAAMVAVGLWGAQLRRPALWLLPVQFPMVMACGAFLALVGLGIPGVEIGIALSAIGLGAMVCLQVKAKLPVALLLVSVFAIFHGHAHGTELPADQSGLAYSAGFVLSTGMLHACGIGIGVIHTWKAGAIVVRVLGGVIVAAGAWFLWQAVA